MTFDVRDHEFNFELILAGVTPKNFDEFANALHESGCNDGTFAISSGIPKITFTRIADNYQEAVNSAVEDVVKAGVKSGIPIVVSTPK